MFEKNGVKWTNIEEAEKYVKKVITEKFEDKKIVTKSDASESLQKSETANSKDYSKTEQPQKVEVEKDLKLSEMTKNDEIHEKEDLKAESSATKNLTKKDVKKNKIKSNPDSDSPKPTIFKTYLITIEKNSEYCKNLIQPICALINSSEEYIKRFGESPAIVAENTKDAFSNMITSKEKKITDLASFCLRIYFTAKEILLFQQKLFNLNLLMKEEKEGIHPKEYKIINNFDELIKTRNEHSLKAETDECQKFMQNFGLSCSAFRYLVSKVLDIQIRSYKQTAFQTLHLYEIFNENSKIIEFIWLQNDNVSTGIIADEKFLDFIAAQNSCLKKYQTLLFSELEAYKNIDFTENSGKQKFADFYPQVLRKSVIEWLNNFLALTENDKLFQFLFNRFYLDGCHLTVFELQFIILSFSKLINIYFCPINYLLILLSSVSQKEFIDVLGYIRIQYFQGYRFDKDSKIYSGFLLIPGIHYKALLINKLEANITKVSEKDLYNVILMLQHISNGSEQLFKIGFNEWIEISSKQKWNEVNTFLAKYDSVGYYLGVLDNNGLTKEAKSLQDIFDNVFVIPEKIIALITSLIINEKDNDEKQFELWKRYLKFGDDYPRIKEEEKLSRKLHLLTNETDQANLLQWIDSKIKENDPCENLFKFKDDRSLESLIKNITGLKDSSDEERQRRQKGIQKIGNILLTNDETNKNIKYLNEFDEKLFKVFKKRLRNTQKMAVLCALENEKNVLEQVNTGEGKSLIVAALATIRCKTGHRFVDIITSSPVLAHRDAESMKPLYTALELTVGDNCNENIEDRKKAYAANIVYGDIAKFQRDYLLHTFYKKLILGERIRDSVIIDEVDNMILDNSNNMLYLSHNVPGMDLFDSLLIFIQQQIFSPLYSANKNTMQEFQSNFDNSIIKQRILTDLFGQFQENDLKAVARDRLSLNQVKEAYEKLVAERIIDKSGYLLIYKNEQIQNISKALLSFSNDVVIQVRKAIHLYLYFLNKIPPKIIN
uniref:Chloroplast protein-transporting ATPase n=1 Tax=Panagrolaimus superbus TaxID=310955 RepID=A0A914Y492_9BILA